jgi:hypothetical protein
VNQEEMRRSMRQTEDVAENLGHRLGSWAPVRTLNVKDPYAAGAIAVCAISNCGAMARLLPRPYGSGVDLDGTAVTMGCPAGSAT